ncbi:hypothetical protein EJE24_22705 [Enterobacter huaxiensis]|uniref:KAP NTPase domain-containing protein n=1 Tax=Enterobacter huaxiensis TaxID=2494702 RepID=A0A3R9N8E6_9ENTR|nr:P-loop NTPase fold protein [Enterobacter huaxiensis]RSK63160.1 hypothetical protein EJE24_22705 [Enterobacter huaxiensis]
MSHSADSSAAGNDKPVICAEEDRYGFNELAVRLTGSIIQLDRRISTVIGIEGRWGSGKTSLLNLLLKQMKTDVPDGTHVMQIAPWLAPSGDSAVEALLLPVAAILDDEAAKSYPLWRRCWHKWRKGKASSLAGKVVSYAQQASGRLAPLAELAGNVMPGGGIAASVLKTVSTADLSARRQTTAELRNEIEKKMASLNLSFIVVLDDLDRLEPTQAVEVLRLIRSVADFSGFHYVLCYDPDVLGHAVEQGLHVGDGRHYLQKIIPLSFNLPRPEAFDLRQEFLRGALELYMKVHNAEPDQTLYYDLKEVAVTFGATLRTPRDVSHVLGSLAFRYDGIKEYVWFPDLCLLQLLRVTLPDWYDWTEHYLTEYAVVASGDGVMSDKEEKRMEDTLRTLLEELPVVSPLSVMKLRRWLPGIGGVNAASPRLFGSVSESDEQTNNQDRRLSSSFYWRCYFAFTPSRNIIQPAFFDNIFQLAGNPADASALATHLLSQIADNGFASRTRFECFLERLTPLIVSRLTQEQCRGLLGFMFEYGDEIIKRFQMRGAWVMKGDMGLKEVTDRLFRHLNSLNAGEMLSYLHESLTDEKRFHWSLSYLRHLLWQNGLAGNRPAAVEDRVIDDDSLKELNQAASAWLERKESTRVLLKLNDLSDLVFAWRDISGPEAVSTWLRSVTRSDEDFLRVMLQLRYEGVSTAKGFYKALRLTAIAAFFGNEQAITQRLNSIESSGLYPELVHEVRNAIGLSQP